jgi:hypothetical protein
MNMTHRVLIKFIALCRLVLFGAAFSPMSARVAGQQAQQKTLPAPPMETAPHRTRLILKDGSYQTVMSYQILSDRVRYVSAERAGVVEEIPLTLVDLDATRKWEHQHADAEEGGGPPVIDPELLKEEAERASFTPEVAPNLHLPQEDSVVGFDTFQGRSELVPMPQSDGELNRSTTHNVLRAAVNPLSSSHQLVELKGERSAVQFHVPDPVLYIRIGTDEPEPLAGTPLTVDTHGANMARTARSKTNLSVVRRAVDT